MSAPIEDWTRPYFRSGGGDALLFYAIFGPIPATFSISGSTYRVDAIPEEVELSSYNTKSHPEVLDSFRSGYLWEAFQHSNSDLAEETAAQTSCLVIRGTITDPESLNYLRNVVGLIAWLFDSGSISVYDPQMFKWWSKQEWFDEVFTPATAVPRRHSIILISEEPSGNDWLHTRGLRKFGRPDLSVHEVPAELREGVIDLINRFIEFQALGGVIEEGREVKLDKLPPGMTCTHRGDTEDPDFNNYHVEILWPTDGHSND